jgi:hypothetical protein
LCVREVNPRQLPRDGWEVEESGMLYFALADARLDLLPAIIAP